MTKLTEQHLLDLGFKRVDVSKEESGDGNDFYYYDLDINGLGLISSDSDSKDILNVSIFNYDGLNAYDYETLKELIDVLKKIQEQSKS
jgi:hypothetical protein